MIVLVCNKGLFVMILFGLKGGVVVDSFFVVVVGELLLFLGDVILFLFKMFVVFLE